MNGIQFLGWTLIVAVATVIEGFAVGFAVLTVRVFNQPVRPGEPVHIFRGRNDQ